MKNRSVFQKIPGGMLVVSVVWFPNLSRLPPTPKPVFFRVFVEQSGLEKKTICPIPFSRLAMTPFAKTGRGLVSLQPGPPSRQAFGWAEAPRLPCLDRTWFAVSGGCKTPSKLLTSHRKRTGGLKKK